MSQFLSKKQQKDRVTVVRPYLVNRMSKQNTPVRIPTEITDVRSLRDEATGSALPPVVNEVTISRLVPTAKKISEFSVDLLPCGITACDNGDIALTGDDNHGGTMYVYDVNGKHIRTLMPPSDTSTSQYNPVDVTINSDNQFIVTNYNEEGSVDLFSTDGEFCRTLVRCMLPRGVASTANSRVVVAADCGSDSKSVSLSVYNQDSGHRIYHVLLTDIRRIAVIPTSGYIVITQKDGVKAYTSDLHKVCWSYQCSQSGGKMIEPYGLYTTAEYVYIADMEGQSVVVLTVGGEYVTTLLTHRDGLERPCELTISNNGHLLLTDLYRQSLAIYKITKKL